MSQMKTLIEKTKEIAAAFQVFKSIIDKYPNAVGLSYSKETGYIVDLDLDALEN
jgi:hypothetical protein